jgi:hypothetical protein
VPEYARATHNPSSGDHADVPHEATVEFVEVH